MSQLRRREILKIGALGAAAAGLGFPAIIRAQAKEVVVLGIWPATGAFSDVGPILDRGMRMAANDARFMSILREADSALARVGGTQAGQRAP